MGFVNDDSIGSIVMVNSLATWNRPYCDQSPNQSITQRLNRAGEEAVRFEKSGLFGFIVKTTCRLRCTFFMKLRYSWSSASIIFVCMAAYLNWFIRARYY